jgi:hypothetical protein
LYLSRYLTLNISALCPENVFNVFVRLSEQTGVNRLIITVDMPREFLWITNRIIIIIILFDRNTKYVLVIQRNSKNIWEADLCMFNIQTISQGLASISCI